MRAERSWARPRKGLRARMLQGKGRLGLLLEVIDMRAHAGALEHRRQREQQSIQLARPLPPDGSGPARLPSTLHFFAQRSP